MQRAIVAVATRSSNAAPDSSVTLTLAVAAQPCLAPDCALERARSGKPAILISEILVPGLDGLSVCRALKSDPRTRDIAILIFSILAAEERALEAGADAFLRKPLNETRLVDSVSTLVRRHLASARDDEGSV